MNQKTDLTTPAVILAAALVITAMITAVAFGPRSLGEQLTPLLLTLLAVVVPAMGALLSRQNAATHNLVNSRMTDFLEKQEAAAVAAREAAMLVSDRRAEDAKVAGIEAGRAETRPEPAPGREA